MDEKTLHEHEPKHEPATPAKPPAKKPYTQPVLTEYGRVVGKIDGIVVRLSAAEAWPMIERRLGSKR